MSPLLIAVSLEAEELSPINPGYIDETGLLLRVLDFLTRIERISAVMQPGPRTGFAEDPNPSADEKQSITNDLLEIKAGLPFLLGDQSRFLAIEDADVPFRRAVSEIQDWYGRVSSTSAVCDWSEDLAIALQQVPSLNLFTLRRDIRQPLFEWVEITFPNAKAREAVITRATDNFDCPEHGISFGVEDSVADITTLEGRLRLAKRIFQTFKVTGEEQRKILHAVIIGDGATDRDQLVVELGGDQGVYDSRQRDLNARLRSYGIEVRKQRNDPDLRLVEARAPVTGEERQ